MTPEITCIIYDMDGLLLDTEGIYTEVTQEIVAEYGKFFDWSIKKKIIGRRSIQAAQIIVDGVDPAQCLVFEDAPSGSEAALAAGMSVVVVPDPNMDHSLYRNASQILSSLKDFDPEYWGLPKFS